MRRGGVTRHASPLSRWGVLSVLGSLSACQVGPAYHAPQTRVPESWATQIPSALSSWPSADWWKAFNSPELDRLMEQARSGNPDVAAAAYRVREAEAQAQIAGAPLLPSLDAGVVAGPSRQLSLSGQVRRNTRYEGLISVQYEFDFWGKNRAMLASAEASANAARFANEVVWITTSTGVANLYFQNLALHERLQIGRDNLVRARRALDDISLAQRRGVVPNLSVVQQQAAVASIEAVLPPLQQQLAATRYALAVLVGVLPEDLQLSGHSLLELAQPTITAGVSSQLLSRRPDIQQAEANLIAANADIRVARAQFFPSLSLPLSAGVETMNSPLRTVPVIGAYSLLGSLTQPIFHGGALRGQLAQREARYQELLVGNYRQAVLSAFGEVETALAALDAAAAEWTAQERSAAFAQQSATMALAGLRGGTGTVLDVLQSQSAVLTAQDTVVQARLGYAQASLSLIKALGGGWEP